MPPKKKATKQYASDVQFDAEHEETVAVKENTAAIAAELNPAGGHIPYKPERPSADTMLANSKEFFEMMNKRRTVRFYSSKPVPIEVFENCIRTAGTAPSGAHLQPWTYVIVQDQNTKDEIREIVEAEEQVNYARRMKESWKNDLKAIGTTWRKPYLSEAPYLVCVFKHTYRMGDEGERLAVYYPEQSVGISVGFFMAAIHQAGLTTLTSTPLGAETALRELLERPAAERLFLLLPIGYAADDCTVPNFSRKPLEEISVVV